MENQTINLKGTFSELSTKSLDSRNRIAIGDALKSGSKEFTRFKIYESKTGDVLLRPVVEIPARELWLYRNKQALSSVKNGLEQSASGDTKVLNKKLLASE